LIDLRSRFASGKVICPKELETVAPKINTADSLEELGLDDGFTEDSGISDYGRKLYFCKDGFDTKTQKTGWIRKALATLLPWMKQEESGPE
jgi:hypothetical protein